MRVILAAVVFFALGCAVGYVFGSGGDVERIWGGVGVPAIVDEEDRPFAQAAYTPTAPLPNNEFVGLWRSVDDAAFTREFFADGQVVDRYGADASATSEGTWHTFMSPTDEQTPFTIQPGVHYLRITMTEEVLYFSVTKVTNTALELVCLGRGNTLRFTRER